MTELIVIGGGLAGSEAAWQAANRGIQVTLYEMRPNKMTEAHSTSNLCELVCSNSLGSIQKNRAPGLLKEELTIYSSMVIKSALESSLPAGGALAVDRDKFSEKVTSRLNNHPNINIIRKEITTLPEQTAIIASGPLTSNQLSKTINNFTDENNLFFYDAIAPIVAADSINMDIAFYASRYDKGVTENGDYINCPFSKDEYEIFVCELINAIRVDMRPFEKNIPEGIKSNTKHQFFEACLPVEIIASRGEKALSFGPMRPVGLIDPSTGKRPYAVVQLRQDNIAATLFNLVGFQTNLKHSEQERVFRMIPGLEKAEFIRFGQMHRNTYICSPNILLPTLQTKKRNNLFFAGQITGTEGYTNSIATGLIAGINAANLILNKPLMIPPKTTMLGAMLHYITSAPPDEFQPMKANFGLLPSLNQKVKGKKNRAELYAKRAIEELKQYIATKAL